MKIFPKLLIEALATSKTFDLSQVTLAELLQELIQRDIIDPEQARKLVLYAIGKDSATHKGKFIGDNYSHREEAVCSFLIENNLCDIDPIASKKVGRHGADFITTSGSWGEIKTTKKSTPKGTAISMSQTLGMFDNISNTQNYQDRYQQIVFAVFENEQLHTLYVIAPNSLATFFAELDKKKSILIQRYSTEKTADELKRALTRGISTNLKEVSSWIGSGLQTFQVT